MDGPKKKYRLLIKHSNLFIPQFVSVQLLLLSKSSGFVCCGWMVCNQQQCCSHLIVTIIIIIIITINKSSFLLLFCPHLSSRSFSFLFLYKKSFNSLQDCSIKLPCHPHPHPVVHNYNITPDKWNTKYKYLSSPSSLLQDST